MTVRITCFTNIDEYKNEEWATELPAVPMVGQWMASRTGKILAIVGLTWLYSGTLRVELHRIG
jgi:hypothetical protein